MLEINPGIWDGLTPDLAKKYYPGDWKRFVKDPYSYRVPRAESYHDLSSKSSHNLEIIDAPTKIVHAPKSDLSPCLSS